MKRRQFIKSGVAVAVAACVPVLAEESNRWGVLRASSDKWVITGDGHRIPITPTPHFNFGEDDFTVEYWTKGPHIDAIRVSEGVARYVKNFTPPEIFCDNEWHHVAYVQDDGRKLTYLDGDVV